MDVRFGPELPTQTRRLVKHMRKDIAEGWFRPFDGPIHDQNGVLRIREEEQLSPWQILHMDWLVENVEGSIPTLDELTPDARELVKIQGVKKE